MSVKQEPSGRRSVQVEVLVPGTPEQVWQAIASGPGISAWFVPSQVDGKVDGAVSSDFGGGMVSAAKITEWQPPHRFVAQDAWLQGGPPIATEWSVEARSGGKCLVRVVHSLFASTDDWDGQLEATEHGWPSYFRVLRHYLEHHAGESSATFVGMAPSQQSAPDTWRTMLRAFGIDAATVGQRIVITAPGVARIAGTVHAVDDLPQGSGVMLTVDEPAPGVVMASAMDCMGMQMATFQAYYYGAKAETAARDQDGWRQWLTALVPPPPPPPENG